MNIVQTTHQAESTTANAIRLIVTPLFTIAMLFGVYALIL